MTITHDQRCAYCGNCFSPQKMTLEHVWPRSLGGNLTEGTLTIYACERCNSLCGLFVDGAFVKSWFIKNQESSGAFQYLNLDAGTPMPMVYMGRLEDFDPAPYATAELWIAPCRSRVLHLHSHNDEKFYSYAGGNPIARRKNRGVAMFLNAADCKLWLRVGLRSFLQHFSEETRFVWGIEASDPPLQRELNARFGGPPDEQHADFVAQFCELERKPIKSGFSLHMDFDQRFMAKLGLGFGTYLLGQPYLETERAQFLRQVLWPGSNEALAELPSVGRGFFEEDIPAMNGVELKWDGGIALSLFVVRQTLVAVIDIFGRDLAFVVSDEPSLWTRRSELLEGRVWVIVPQVARCVGPLRLGDFIGHRRGVRSIDELQELDALRKGSPRLNPGR